VVSLRSLIAAVFLGLMAFYAQAASDKPLRVVVLENSPPMSFVDQDGQLTGFSPEVMRALCFEMKVDCVFQAGALENVLSMLASGEVDVAAVSMLDTPQRREKMIFAKPYFRSVSFWFAKPGVQPGQSGIRVAVVHGSAQERYALNKAWETIAVRTNGELAEPLIAGVAQAAIVPMSTGLNLMKKPGFRDLNLTVTAMGDPTLAGDAAFGISRRRPELKEPMDAALDRIKNNGVYDRINTKFLPFRVN
jgi:ABC-type amino acid transport substrate-binding protein